MLHKNITLDVFITMKLLLNIVNFNSNYNNSPKNLEWSLKILTGEITEVNPLSKMWAMSCEHSV